MSIRCMKSIVQLQNNSAHTAWAWTSAPSPDCTGKGGILSGSRGFTGDGHWAHHWIVCWPLLSTRATWAHQCSVHPILLFVACSYSNFRSKIIKPGSRTPRPYIYNGTSTAWSKRGRRFPKCHLVNTTAPDWPRTLERQGKEWNSRLISL